MIRRYGGAEGIRDGRALESAIMMPRAGSVDGYFHEDLSAMAAAYLYHLAQDHPFVDGNKRVAAAAADVFLALNGVDLSVDESEYEQVVREVASGGMTKERLARFFREHARPSEDESAD